MAEIEPDPKDVKKEADRDGEIFQDALTENESKPPGALREDAEETDELDPDIENVEPTKRK